MQLQSISRNIQNVIKNSTHFLNAHLCSPHKNLQSYHTKKIEKYHTVTEKFAPRPSKNSTKLQQFFDSHFWYTQSPYCTQKPPSPSHKETFKFPENPAQFTPETLFIHLRNQNLSNVPHFFNTNLWYMRCQRRMVQSSSSFAIAEKLYHGIRERARVYPAWRPRVPGSIQSVDTLAPIHTGLK